MEARRYRDADWGEWLRMSIALFPHETSENLAAGMRDFRARNDAEVFVVARSDESLSGFVEVGSRLYADGCDSSPVGYIEAWFVDEDIRRLGLGRALLDAAEGWARQRGYTEMASDALLDNIVSHRAHERAGYAEVERVVQFRKPIANPSSVAT